MTSSLSRINRINAATRNVLPAAKLATHIRKRSALPRDSVSIVDLSSGQRVGLQVAAGRWPRS
jgi:hypothetical protein